MQAEILMKYEGILKEKKKMQKKRQSWITYKIKPFFDFKSVPSLSLEARDKWTKLRPNNHWWASRISGINLADISVFFSTFRKINIKVPRGNKCQFERRLYMLTIENV